MNNFKTLGLGIAIVGVVATMVGISYAQQTTTTSTDDTSTSMNKHMSNGEGHRNHMKRDMMKQGKHGPKRMAGLGMKGGMMGPMNQDPAIKAALEANDYAAFSVALKAKKADATIPSAEQFGMMVKHYQQHKAIDAALETNNYEAFKTAIAQNVSTDTTRPARPIPTAEQFADMVKRHQEHKAINAALDANDYEAFKLAAKDSPMIKKVTTAEQFATLAEFHKAVKAGDAATIEKLKASATLPMMHKGKGERKGQRKGNKSMGGKRSNTLRTTGSVVGTGK